MNGNIAEYLDKYCKLDLDYSPPILLHSVKQIDYCLEHGLFILDGENRVWCDTARVYEDAALQRKLKYNNEE